MNPKAVNAYPDMVEKWGYRGFPAGLDREYARRGPDARTEISLACLHLFNGIFALERKVSVFDRDYRELTAEIRRRWSASLFECLTRCPEELAETVCVRRRSGARAAAGKPEPGAGVACCLNNIKELGEFLSNPDLCISNAISGLNIAGTARARCTKKILRTMDAAHCYGVPETLALSCRRNGAGFTTWLLWVCTEMAKRYCAAHGGQPLRMPVPCKVPPEVSLRNSAPQWADAGFTWRTACPT
ncbi:MAG TPA: hypothetical protein IAB18_07305 [Candidatus Avisuccinivibrio pullicola]|nr:hypothetical protein [Candidatus Avisuccinivibrio pullicola]